MDRVIALPWLLLWGLMSGYCLIPLSQAAAVNESYFNLSTDDLFAFPGRNITREMSIHHPSIDSTLQSDLKEGYLTKFLSRITRNADNVIALLNDASNSVMKDVLKYDHAENVKILSVKGSQGVQMQFWQSRIIVSVTESNDNVTLYAMNLDTQQVTAIASFPGIFNCDMTAIPGEQLMVACVSPHIKNELNEVTAGVAVYILGEDKNGGNINYRLQQLLPTNSSSHLTLWRQFGETMLMIGSVSAESDTKASRHVVQSAIYRWTGQYFDLLQVFPPANTSSVHHFVINNYHFIAVAHYTNSKGQHNCHSTIYRYSTDGGRYMPFQSLPTKGAKDFMSFKLGSKGHNSTFLAVANYCQDDSNGTCNPYTSSQIYCYHYDRFVLFQEIPTAYAVQWLAIEVENNILLLVANALTGVKMYQYNGWRFVLTDSQLTQGPFSAGVNTLTAVGINEKILLGVSNQDPLKAAQAVSPFYLLYLKRANFLKTYENNTEKWFRRRLGALESSDITRYKKLRAAQITEKEYTFTKPVTVTGDLVVIEGSFANQVYTLSNNESIPSLPVELKKKEAILEEKYLNITKKLEKSIPIKGLPTWPSNMIFRHLESSSVTQVKIGNLRAVSINGESVSVNQFIRVAQLGNGQFSQMHFTHINMQGDVTLEKLNGEPFVNYIGLNSNHRMRNHVVFKEDIKLQNSSNLGKIIEVTDDIKGHRELSLNWAQPSGLFSCSSMYAAAVECDDVNGISIPSLLKNVVTKSGAHNFTGELGILDRMVYNSNFLADVNSSINMYSPVKLNTPEIQIVTGPLEIGNLKTTWLNASKINSVSIPEELLLNQPDVSYILPNTLFKSLTSNSITVRRNLDKIKVNNGSLNIMRVNEDQFVSSRKVFKTIKLTVQNPNREKLSLNKFDDSQGDNFQRNDPSQYSRGYDLEPNLYFLLQAVRSEAEIDHVVKYMVQNFERESQMPLSLHKCFELLYQNSKWDLIYEYCGSTFENYYKTNSENNWKSVYLFLNESIYKNLSANVETFKVHLNTELETIDFTWLDAFKIFALGRRHLYNLTLHDLSSIDILIELFSRTSEETAVRNLAKNCTLCLLCDAVQKISYYPSILKRFSHIPIRMGTVFERALVDLDVSLLLAFISKNDQLLQLLEESAVSGKCDISISQRQTVVDMLKYFHNSVTSNYELFTDYWRNEEDVIASTVSEELPVGARSSAPPQQGDSRSTDLYKLVDATPAPGFIDLSSTGFAERPPLHDQFSHATFLQSWFSNEIMTSPSQQFNVETITTEGTHSVLVHSVENFINTQEYAFSTISSKSLSSDVPALRFAYAKKVEDVFQREYRTPLDINDPENLEYPALPEISPASADLNLYKKVYPRHAKRVELNTASPFIEGLDDADCPTDAKCDQYDASVLFFTSKNDHSVSELGKIEPAVLSTSTSKDVIISATVGNYWSSAPVLDSSLRLDDYELSVEYGAYKSTTYDISSENVEHSVLKLVEIKSYVGGLDEIVPTEDRVVSELDVIQVNVGSSWIPQERPSSVVSSPVFSELPDSFILSYDTVTKLQRPNSNSFESSFSIVTNTFSDTVLLASENLTIMQDTATVTLESPSFTSFVQSDSLSFNSATDIVDFLASIENVRSVEDFTHTILPAVKALGNIEEATVLLTYLSPSYDFTDPSGYLLPYLDNAASLLKHVSSESVNIRNPDITDKGNESPQSLQLEDYRDLEQNFKNIWDSLYADTEAKSLESSFLPALDNLPALPRELTLLESEFKFSGSSYGDIVLSSTHSNAFESENCVTTISYWYGTVVVLEPQVSSVDGISYTTLHQKVFPPSSSYVSTSVTEELDENVRAHESFLDKEASLRKPSGQAQSLTDASTVNYDQVWKAVKTTNSNESQNLEDQRKIINKEFQYTTNTHFTQFTTYIKCIQCTFIFKSFSRIVSDTLLVGRTPSPSNYIGLELSHALTESSSVPTERAQTTNPETEKDLLARVQLPKITPSPVIDQNRLENITKYIEEFKILAASNFSKNAPYDFAADNRFENIVNKNYEYLWSLRYNMDSVVHNVSYLSSSRQSLKLGKKLANYLMSPETLTLLSSIAKAAWLKELEDVLNIMLKRSLGVSISPSEEEMFENITKLQAVSVSPLPYHKITKEKVKQHLVRLSSLKNRLRSKKPRVPKKPRHRREADEKTNDILFVGRKLRTYLQAVIDSPRNFSVVIPDWDVEQLLSDYEILEEKYLNSSVRIDEIDEITREMDSLIEEAIGFVEEYEKFEEERCSEMEQCSTELDEGIVTTTEYAFEKEEPSYPVHENRTSYIIFLQQYFKDLMSNLTYKQLKLILDEKGEDDDFILDVLDNLINRTNALKQDVWTYFKGKKLQLQRLKLLGTVMELIEENEHGVSKVVANKLEYLKSTAPSMLRKIDEILKLIQKRNSLLQNQDIIKCEDAKYVSKFPVHTGRQLTYIQRYFNQINSTRPWKFKKRPLFAEDREVSLHLEKLISTIIDTVELLNSNILLELESSKEDILKRQVTDLESAVQFAIASQLQFPESFFQKLEYLKVLLPHAIARISCIIKHFEERDGDIAKITLQLPSSTALPTQFITAPNSTANYEATIDPNETLQLEIFLNFTKKIMFSNPLNKTKFSNASFSELDPAITSSIDAVLLALKCVMNDLQTNISGIDMNLDIIIKDHSLVMERIQGNIEKLSPVDKLKLFMIYGESHSGRAAVTEKLIEQALNLRRVEYVTSTSDPKPYVPMSFINGTSEQKLMVFESWVHGLVSGYNLKDFSTHQKPLSTGKLQPEQFIDKNMGSLQNIVIHGGLAANLVQNVDMDHLSAHALPLSMTNISREIHFNTNVQVVGDLNATSVNDIAAQDYVLQSGTADFNEHIKFTDLKAENDVEVLNFVNGIDLGKFSGRVVSTNFTRRFLPLLKFSNVKVESVFGDSVTVSGVSIEQVIPLRDTYEVEITGNKTFKVLQLSGDVQINALRAQTVNDEDMDSLFYSSLLKSTEGQQNISQVTQLLRLVVDSNMTTSGLSFADITSNNSAVYLPRLVQYVVHKAKSSFITSDIVFAGETSIQSLQYLGTFDGVTPRNFSEGWLLKTSDQKIIGRVSAADMNASSVILNNGSKIYGIDFARLISAVKINETTVFPLDISFSKVFSNQSISVGGLVQGWNLSSESIGKSSRPVRINAHKIFLATVTITQNIKIQGYINNLNLSTGCHTYPHKRIFVNGNVHIGQDVVAEEIEAGNSVVNSKNVDVYWQRDKNAVISNSVSFKKTFIRHLNSTLNYIDINKNISSVLVKTCEDWNRFSDYVTVNRLVTHRLHTHSAQVKTLNGELVTSFKNILQHSGDQVFSGQVTFNNITIKGNVSSGPQNKINVNRICQQRKTCLVQAVKIFSGHVHVLGDHHVNPNRTVQGVDISEAFFDLSVNYGHISGITKFTSDLKLSELRVDGLVDGISVKSDSLLLRIGNQDMNATLNVSSLSGRAIGAPSLSADEWILFPMNVTELLARSVHLNRSNTIDAPVIFENEVIFKSVHLGLELENMKFSENRTSLMHDSEKAFNIIYYLNSINQKVVKDQVHELWGWRRVQQFEESVERVVPIINDTQSKGSLRRNALDFHYLALIPKIGNARILVRNLTRDYYDDPGLSLYGDCVSEVVGFRSEGHTFALTGHKCLESSQQQSNDVRVWEILADRSQLVQSLPVGGVAEMQIVTIADKICVLVVDSSKNHTALYCEERGSFVLDRIIEKSPQKVSVLHHVDPDGRKLTFVALANKGEHPSKQGTFIVWLYDSSWKSFTSFPEVELDNVVWVELVSQQNEVFLVAVSQAYKGNPLGQVNIYRLEWGESSSETSNIPRTGVFTPNFNFLQQVSVEDPLEAHFSTLNKDLYLFIISQDGYVTWFSKKGIQRFSKEGELHVPSKQQMEVWTALGNESQAHWISVTSQDCSYEDSTYNQESDQILHVNIRGNFFEP